MWSGVKIGAKFNFPGNAFFLPLVVAVVSKEVKIELRALAQIEHLLVPRCVAD